MKLKIYDRPQPGQSMAEPVGGAAACGQSCLVTSLVSAHRLAQDTLGLTPAQTSMWFVKTALLFPPKLTFFGEGTPRRLILQWTRHPPLVSGESHSGCSQLPHHGGL